MDLQRLLTGWSAVMAAGQLSAEVVSQGGFVSGAVEAVAGTYSLQAFLDVGAGSTGSDSRDYSMQSGALAAIQNRPHIASPDGRLVAAAGAEVTVTHADVLRLSGAREFDGETLAFRITTTAGSLGVNGQPISTLVLAAGGVFVWTLPNDITTVPPTLAVVAVDAVGLTAAAGARLNYEANVAPTGNEDEVFRPIGLQPFKIRVADLLANDTDANGDRLGFAGLVSATSEAGRALQVLHGRWIVYYPALADEPADDRFSYSLSDGNGGGAQAVVWVRERVIDRAGLNIVAAIDSGGGQLSIRARGIPGRTYQAQVATAFTPPDTTWVNLGDPVQASPTDGSFAVSGLAAGAGGQRFYRTIEVTPGGVGP